jgi:8-oxo-dGTP pyrophosphatase MutT (NUDIX family)
VFVRNNAGKYLFYKRTEFPFRLTVPSGHVDQDESAKVAAARELREEAGIEPDLTLLATEEVRGDSCSAAADAHVWNAFLAELADDGQDITILEEGEAPLWLTLDEALEQGTVFVIEYMIKKCRAKL